MGMVEEGRKRRRMAGETITLYNLELCGCAS